MSANIKLLTSSRNNSQEKITNPPTQPKIHKTGSFVVTAWIFYNLSFAHKSIRNKVKTTAHSGSRSHESTKRAMLAKSLAVHGLIPSQSLGPKIQTCWKSPVNLAKHFHYLRIVTVIRPGEWLLRPKHSILGGGQTIPLYLKHRVLGWLRQSNGAKVKGWAFLSLDLNGQSERVSWKQEKNLFRK